MPSALSHVAGSQQRPQSSSGWLCMACLGTHCASGCLAAQHGPCKIIKICRGLRTCTSARSWSRHTLKLNAHTMSAGLQRRSSASPLHASHASAPQQRPAHEHTVSLPRSSVPPSMSPLCPVSGGAKSCHSNRLPTLQLRRLQNRAGRTWRASRRSAAPADHVVRSEHAEGVGLAPRHSLVPLGELGAGARAGSARGLPHPCMRASLLCSACAACACSSAPPLQRALPAEAAGLPPPAGLTVWRSGVPCCAAAGRPAGEAGAALLPSPWGAPAAGPPVPGSPTGLLCCRGCAPLARGGALTHAAPLTGSRTLQRSRQSRAASPPSPSKPAPFSRQPHASASPSTSSPVAVLRTSPRHHTPQMSAEPQKSSRKCSGRYASISA